MSESLWNIETRLADLMQARESALDRIIEEESVQVPADTQPAKDMVLEACRYDLAKIDEALAEYAQAEVRKVDGIRSMWRYLRDGHAIASAEAEVQHQRAKSFERRLNALKSAVLIAMEMMPWRPDQPKKLEGETGSLMLRGNGGKRPVMISDESLVPDEFKTVTMTITAKAYERIWPYLTSFNAVPSAKTVAVSRTLIAQALEQKCPACGGDGRWKPGMLTAKCGQCGRECEGPDCWHCRQHPDTCTVCGGSGLSGVPGCALGERGSTVVCK